MKILRIQGKNLASIAGEFDIDFTAAPLRSAGIFAICGPTGAGKSTMLKILAGLQQPTEGVVAVQRGITIGYLPQVMILSDTRTVMAEAEMAFEHIFEM